MNDLDTIKAALADYASELHRLDVAVNTGDCRDLDYYHAKVAEAFSRLSMLQAAYSRKFNRTLAIGWQRILDDDMDI